MKSLKKTLVLLVVFSMILSTLAPVFAATDVLGLDCEDQVTRMEALGIIKGFEDGTFRPDETITRAQMAVIICKMLGINEASAEANKNVPSKFSDVAAGDWYTGYVNIASNNGIISGYPDGTFRPNQTLTLNEVLTLCVKALGRGGYVDKMGTWPANYVTEAARLNLLKDVTNAADANRGTVAVICWNTLNTATWYVNSENLDGEVTLGIGQETKTLLAINFADFATKNGNFKEIEGVKIGAADIADNDRQLKLAASKIVTVDDEESFADQFAKKPSKNTDEKSYKTADGKTVYVYVPEEVCEDLDDLINKTVTIILGEDDIAALIIVEDDIVEPDYLTEYDNVKGKIVVGGTKYTLSENGYDVTLNGADEYGEVICDCGKKTAEGCNQNTHTTYVAPTTVTLPNALALLGITNAEDYDDIEKKIEATVTLDDEDEVEGIELVASMTIADVSREALVLKVKENSSEYEIKTTDGTFSWDLEEEEEEEIEFPKVYVDGDKASIRDIAEGNVITVMTAEEDLDGIDVEDIEKIYVSTKKITGEATKIKKANNEIQIDGTYYAPSFAVAGQKIMTSEELSKATSAEDWKEYDSKKILENDEVTLYLNMFGEYIAVSLEEVASDYVFGVVTSVSPTMAYSGEDDEYEVVKIKVLLADGNKKTFTLSLDTSDEDLMKKLDHSSVMNYRPTEGNFVMFEADAERVITIEDNTPFTTVIAVENSNIKTRELGKILNTEDYLVTELTGNIDEKEFNAKYGAAEADVIKNAEYVKEETVIFNLKEKEVVSKWDSIVVETNNVEAFAGKTYMIFEDDKADVPMFIVTYCTYVDSDAVYAIAGEEGLYQIDDKFYADLVGTEGIEFTSSATSKEVVDGWLVEYAMSSSKLSKAFSIIDLNKFNHKDTKKNKVTVAEIMNLSDRDDTDAVTLVPATALKTGFSAANKLEAIELSSIKARTSSYRLNFVEIDDVAIDSIIVDEDVKVYDLRNGVTVGDIDDVQAEVADGEKIFAIPCTNGSDDVLFIL